MAGTFMCLVCDLASPRPIHQGVCWAWASPEQKLEARQTQQVQEVEQSAASMGSRWAEGEDAPAECPPHQWEQDSRGRTRWDEFSSDGLNIGVRCLKCRRAKLIVEERFARQVYQAIKDEAEVLVESS